ncbi:Nonsense-mediated mRNA decay protein 5, partial [Spiromyces aspiralis]
MDNPKDQTLPAAALQQPAEDSNLTTGDANSSPIYHAGDGFGDDNDYYFVDDIDESPEYLPENWPPRILRRIAQYLPTPKDRLEFSLVHPNWTSFGLEVLWQEPELTSPKAFYKFMRAARASPMRAQSIRGLQLTLDESVAPLADGNATNNNNSDGAALVAAALEGLSATGMLKEHRAVAQTSLGSQRMLFEMIRNVDNIERLAFYGYNTHDRDFIHLARRAGTLRKLEVIGLPEQAPRTMIPFFRTLTRLAFISIQLDALSLTADVSYDALWRGLEIRADRLVELNLRVPSISRANIEGILNKCRELRILRLVSDRPSGSGGGIELHDE